jgi:hypothetical protein
MRERLVSRWYTARERYDGMVKLDDFRPGLAPHVGRGIEQQEALYARALPNEVGDVDGRFPRLRATQRCVAT